MNRTALGLAGIAAFALAGCASTPEFQYYVLGAEGRQVVAPPDPAATRVSLAQVAIPELVDRSQLVLRVAPHRVEMAEFHRWGEPLREGVARVLAENLGRHLGARYAVSAGLHPGAPAAVQVAVAVRRFDAVPASEVAIHADWSVRPAAGPARAGESRVQEPITEASHAGIAAAFSRALDRIAGDIAEAVAHKAP